jgi:intein/homing endonuclease
LESLIHETSIATLVSLGDRAVNKVLLGKADEVVGGDEVSTLSGTGGGERPARSALTLVLNASNGTLSSPVPRRRSRGIDLSLDEGGGSLGDIHTTSPGGELLEGLVGELIDGDGEALSLGVVLLDELEVSTEDGETKIVLYGRIVFLGVLGLPFGEGQGRLAFRKGESASEKCDEE